jgi:3-methyladenine DNA glycosylase Tag
VKENWEKFVDKNNMILNRAKLISIFKDNAKKCEEITAEKLRNKKEIIQFIKENEIENKY